MRDVDDAVFLIFGWGLLGQALARAATDMGCDYRYVASSAVEPGGKGWRADICEGEPPPEVFAGATHIVHTKAITSVAECEKDPVRARVVNATLVEDVSRWGAHRGIPVVYPSTDWVFDGAEGHYSECDATNPLNVYGATKLLGEQAVLASGGLVVRGSFVGARPDGRPGLRELLMGDAPPAVGRPRRSNPLWVGDYATFMLSLALAGQRGVVHLGSSTHTSWHSFCAEARRRLHGTDDVLPAPGDAIARPANTVLSTDLASRLLGTTMPTADDVRRRFVACGPMKP